MKFLSHVPLGKQPFGRAGVAASVGAFGDDDRVERPVRLFEVVVYHQVVEKCVMTDFRTRVLQPALHYELDRINKPEILRKLKRRYGNKTIRDLRFRLG